MKMDLRARAHAMEAFCRQRAKMEDESVTFWLTEAAFWAKQASSPGKKQVSRKTPPVPSGQSMGR
jgi:hypothetical protein